MAAKIQTHTSNPMDYIMDVVPVLDNCNKNQDNCICTDPSWGYQTQCKLSSNLNDKTMRTRCYFGSPPASGASSYINTGFIDENSGTNIDYTINPNNSGPASVTTGVSSSSGNPIPATGVGPNKKYPVSYLFCANPDGLGSAPNGAPTDSTTNLTYNSTTQTFKGWTANKSYNDYRKTQTNLGFDKS